MKSPSNLSRNQITKEETPKSARTEKSLTHDETIIPTHNKPSIDQKDNNNENLINDEKTREVEEEEIKTENNQNINETNSSSSIKITTSELLNEEKNENENENKKNNNDDENTNSDEIENSNDFENDEKEMYDILAKNVQKNFIDNKTVTRKSLTLIYHSSNSFLKIIFQDNKTL
jgi:hypothetical protein